MTDVSCSGILNSSTEIYNKWQVTGAPSQVQKGSHVVVPFFVFCFDGKCPDDIYVW